MALTAGDRLGIYEIVALLGYGGMGEVYRARDTRLGREVAIKILPAAFATDPNRLARLEREARLISQINHPNVCTLFHIGDASGPNETHFLVLELVEGETLQQRLIRGPMHVRDALRYAADIAAALEAAHAKGIIHRDLKPSNIKITEGRTIKVLDFGVAKLAEELDAGPNASPLMTVTLGGTREGALVGTVAYISPEQAMGDSVDKRTDIWSFGCVFYEMLTAERAFPGVAIADTLANVMRGDPNWAKLPAETPAPIRKLLERCLIKDRTRRLADIADARFEIDEAIAAPSVRMAAAPVRAKARAGFKTLVAFLSGIVATLWVSGAFELYRERRNEDASRPETASLTQPSVTPAKPVVEPTREMSSRATPPAPKPTVEMPTRTSISPPPDITWSPSPDRGIHHTVLAVSPDGGRIAFTAREGATTSLWLQALDGSSPMQLPDTEDASSPFWSPDGASVGFFAAGLLKRLDLSSPNTVPIVLCQVVNGRGAAWGPDDTIVFGGNNNRPLAQVSARGGSPRFLTRLEPGEQNHVRPHFLAGSRHFLYRATGSNVVNNAYYAMTLGSPERKLVMKTASGNVMYSMGHLLFVQGSALMAQRFDLGRLSVVGAPVPIVDRIRISMVAPPRFGIFSVSQTGRLAYLPDGGGEVPMTILNNWPAMLK
jgi:serine/threonine protein kinase